MSNVCTPIPFQATNSYDISDAHWLCVTLQCRLVTPSRCYRRDLARFTKPSSQKFLESWRFSSRAPQTREDQVQPPVQDRARASSGRRCRAPSYELARMPGIRPSPSLPSLRRRRTEPPMDGRSLQLARSKVTNCRLSRVRVCRKFLKRNTQ